MRVISKIEWNGEMQKKACENLNFSELSGWRVPTVKELKRMYTVYHKQEPSPFVNISRYAYWSSTPSKGQSKYVYVNLEGRDEDTYCGVNVCRKLVWCVRGCCP